MWLTRIVPESDIWSEHQSPPRREREVAATTPPTTPRTVEPCRFNGSWCLGYHDLRRVWDLNPRAPCGVSGFQDRCTRPLCEPSRRDPFVGNQSESSSM
jgi:hypothetical protein